MGHADDICYGILTSYAVPGVHGPIGALSILLVVLFLVNAGVMIYWVHRQVKLAKQGVEGAVRHLIFPVYMPFLRASALSDLLVAIVLLCTDFRMFSSNDWITSSAIALILAGEHVVMEGVAFMLMQHGCGRQAVTQAFSYALLWGLFTFAFYLIYAKSSGSLYSSLASIVLQLALLLFYLALWRLPLQTLFRRQALRRYAKFWSIFRCLVLIAEILFIKQLPTHTGAVSCFSFFAPVLTFIIFKPMMVYYALMADTSWWQGLQRRSKRLVHNDLHLRSPLIGVEVPFSDAEMLAQNVDKVHRDGVVKLLNFAYMTLDKASLLGCGSFSKVYKGTYRSSPVAIKLIFTVDLNPEIIGRCMSEAEILSKIRHPNVVDIYGVCVFPPSVCLVLEICHYGSLSDVIRGSNAGGIIRAPLKLSLADRMYLVLGCVRGLQALHKNNLCHRDVKSHNFLVDNHLNAKIADLELGGAKAYIPDKPEGLLCTWHAPEILMGEDGTQASDIYAMSLVLWEVLTGQVPYREYGNQTNIRAKVLQGCRPPIYPNCDRNYAALMCLCWQEIPSQRPDVSFLVEVVSGCWVGAPGLGIPGRTALNIDWDIVSSAALREKTQPKKVFQPSPHLVNNRSPVRQPFSEELNTQLSYFSSSSECQQLASISDSGVLVTSPTLPLLMLWCNKRWSQMMGYFGGDILAREVAMLSGPNTDHLQLRNLYADAARGVPGHCVVRLYRRDGNAFVCSLHAYHIRKAPTLDLFSESDSKVDNSSSHHNSFSTRSSQGGEIGYIVILFSAIQDSKS